MTAGPAQLDTGIADELVVSEPACLACGHDVADHDAIGRRYCRATEARALARGCICRPPAT
jgi:hypothetical protein